MTDIVARLEALVGLDAPECGGPFECVAAMRDAAAEIRRLRALSADTRTAAALLVGAAMGVKPSAAWPSGVGGAVLR